MILSYGQTSRKRRDGHRQHCSFHIVCALPYFDPHADVFAFGFGFCVEGSNGGPYGFVDRIHEKRVIEPDAPFKQCSYISCVLGCLCILA